MEEREGRSPPVPDRPEERHARLEQPTRRHVVSLRPSQHAGSVERRCPGLGGAGRAAECQRPLEPAAALAQMAAELPEVAQGPGQSQRRLPITGLREAPGKRRAEVVVVGLQPIEPHRLLRAVDLRACFLRQAQEEGRVPSLQGDRLPARGQPLERILSNRLQHHEPGFAAGRLLLPQQALVQQRPQAVQDLGPAHRFGRFEGAAADEDGEPPEELLLAPAEQVVAPGDRIAERLLARGQVRGPARQQREPTLQPGQQRRGR